MGPNATVNDTYSKHNLNETNTFFLRLTAIGRTLIPRYFRTIFEGGVTELNYQLRHAKESFHQTTITLDCDQCTMVTQHGKPMYTKVCLFIHLYYHLLEWSERFFSLGLYWGSFDIRIYLWWLDAHKIVAFCCPNTPRARSQARVKTVTFYTWPVHLYHY